MTTLLHAGLVALVFLVVAYILFVRAQLKQPRTFAYTSFPCELLRELLGGRGMVALTLWHRCYIFAPGSVSFFGPGTHGRVHEATHMDQFDAHPYLFPLLYLWAMRRGYGCNKYEEQARRAAGEPSECGRPPAAS